MATCSLMDLSAGACSNKFLFLDEADFDAVELQLLYNLSGETSTLAQLISQACANGFQFLDEADFNSLELQLYCNILGGQSPEIVCTPPLAPVIVEGTVNGADITIIWTLAQDPDKDFVFHWGHSVDGPFPNTYTLAANIRSSTFDAGAGIINSNVYGYLIAEDSISCISNASNTFLFTLSG